MDRAEKDMAGAEKAFQAAQKAQQPNIEKLKAAWEAMKSDDAKKGDAELAYNAANEKLQKVEQAFTKKR